MKTVKVLIFLFSISALVVFFQNCSVPENQGILGSKDTSHDTVAEAVQSAPFAYDLAVDTISYNSCVGENLNTPGGIHGLKLGANEGFADLTGSGAVKSGLKLRSEFLNYVGKITKPRYPSTTITPAQVKDVLAHSDANKDAILQFAVRRASDLRVMMDLIQPGAQSTVAIPRDGNNVASLYSDNILTLLTKNVQFDEKGAALSEGSRIYNLADPAAPEPIEFSFGFSNIIDETYAKQNLQNDSENYGIGEQYSDVIRNRFNQGTGDKYILAITYGGAAKGTTADTDSGLNSIKRKLETDKTKAYGRAFALTFAYPAAAVAAGWKKTALKDVKEMSLEGGGQVAGVTWSCSNYLIMKRNQWNNGKASQPSCAPLIAGDFQNSTFAGKIRDIRRHYRERDWDVGLFYDKDEVYNPATRLGRTICLVPKETECYLPTDTVVPGTDVGVNYNPLQECYLYNKFGVSYVNPVSAVKTLGRCAQFASICVRTSQTY